MIAAEETHDTSIKTSFLEAQKQETVIQREEKLCDIKYYNTGMVFFKPSCLNKMGEVDASINSKLLPDASKLIRIQEAISYYVKLKSVANDFLNEFTSSVEQNNGVEKFGSAIQVLIQLGDNDSVSRLEVRWPML